MSKATPKAGLTLLSKSDDDKLQFLHSPSGAADFSLKHKLNKKFTMGVGFSVGSGGLQHNWMRFHAIHAESQPWCMRRTTPCARSGRSLASC